MVVKARASNLFPFHIRKQGSTCRERMSDTQMDRQTELTNRHAERERERKRKRTQRHRKAGSTQQPRHAHMLNDASKNRKIPIDSDTDTDASTKLQIENHASQPMPPRFKELKFYINHSPKSGVGLGSRKQCKTRCEPSLG